jgi:flagellar basal-body rod protein FlgB
MELDLTATVAARALDGVFARQLAVAHNIANANSPGFAPVRVSFETALQQALAASSAGDRDPLRTAAISVRADRSEPMRLDLEVTASAENAMRYSMLLGLLDRKLQVLSLAINEGRSR